MVCIIGFTDATGTIECFAPNGCIGNGSVDREYVIAGGEATVSVDATVMITHLNFIGMGETARHAYNEQRQIMEKVKNMLMSKGINEMQTSNLRIEPIYGEHKNDPYWHSDYSEITGYKVHNTLIVKVRNQSIFDEVLVDSIDLGVNNIGDMRFIPDAQAIKDAKNKAKQFALIDAKENAQWQANILDRKLKEIIYVGDATEDIIHSNPNPWWGNQMASNIATQTSVYLSEGNVEEVESLSPGRMTFKAKVGLGYRI